MEKPPKFERPEQKEKIEWEMGAAEEAGTRHEMQDRYFMEAHGAAVFDGVSMNKDGGRAADIAREMFTKVLPVMTKALAEETTDENARKAVWEIVNHLNGSALEEKIRNKVDGSTTIAGVVFGGRRAAIIHLGDSRVYGQSEIGELDCLTEDHSMFYSACRDFMKKESISQSALQRALSRVDEMADLARLAVMSDKQLAREGLTIEDYEILVKLNKAPFKSDRKELAALVDKNLSLLEVFFQHSILTSMIISSFGKSRNLIPMNAVHVIDASAYKQFLLVTDGVSNNINDAELEQMMEVDREPSEMADACLEMADMVASNPRDPRATDDDMTAVVIKRKE